jgi:DNA-binding LacI/PurR family transcriptional regulator
MWGRSEPTRLIALLFPVVFTHGAYFRRQFMSFMETLSEAHYDVLTRIHDHAGVRLPPIVMRGDADAIVTMTHPDELAAMQAALATTPASLRRPLVTLINPAPGAWTVTADLRLGGRLEMDHLLDLGHRRIITIGNMAFRSEERVAGCREALAARGLDPDRHLVVLDTDRRITDPEQRLPDVLDRLLSAAPDATAMLAPQDQAAQQLVGLLAERGRPVPERMSLVGFDDTDPVLGAGNQNILTTVALPLEQIGREAGLLAMDPGPTPRTIVLPVGLRVRGTTRAVTRR